MKRIDLVVLSIVFAVLFSGVVFSADDSSDSSNGGAKARFRWNVTAVLGGVNSPSGCVGQTVRVAVLNYNTHKPVEQADVRFYLNGTTHIATATTNSDGVADYSPVQAGNYGIVLVHLGYKDVAFYFNVSSACSTAPLGATSQPPQSSSTTLSASTTSSIASATTLLEKVETTTTSSTTTSLTSTTVSAASTSSEAPSTTLAAKEVSTTISQSISISTVPQPTCSDGMKNQGESGIDCGGPCNACASGGSNAPILLLVVAIVLMIAVYSYLQSQKKTKRAPEEDSGHFHKHHRHRKK